MAAAAGSSTEPSAVSGASKAALEANGEWDQGLSSCTCTDQLSPALDRTSRLLDIMLIARLCIKYVFPEVAAAAGGSCAASEAAVGAQARGALALYTCTCTDLGRHAPDLSCLCIV